MILGGEIKPGERLNEQALASRFGVSRGPVREALRGLERLGLVTAVVNHGVFVREISVAEAMEIYELRAVVHGFACARAAERAGADGIARLEALVHRMDEAIAREDSQAYYALNLEFHDTILSCAGHGKTRQVYECLVKETHLFRQSSLDSTPRMRESNEEHRALVAAIRSRDGAKARALGEAHSLAGKRRYRERAAESRDGRQR